MRNLKVRVLLAALMFVLALGAGLLPTVDATEFETEIGGEGTGVWAEVCCGSGCSPSAYCVGDGTYTCCRGTAAN